MKTLQLVPAMEQGGVERGIIEMNRVILSAGWTNVVVSAGGRLVADLVREGACHKTLDVKSKNPFTYFARAARLRELLRVEKPDVVCAHSRVPAWLFVRAARGLDIPWISFAHGANSISRYSRIMTRGDLTVTPSRYIADYLKAAYGLREEKIRVIPRAIDRARFDCDKLDADFMAAKKAAWHVADCFVVMALGRITQLKSYDVLIRALAHLQANNHARPFKLVLVGEAEAKRKDVEADLKRLVSKLHLEPSVVFAGNQAKVAECLSLADVVVSSNIKKPEAFGRSMAEALAMGKPVVARAFGGACDVVRDGTDGILVPSSDDWPRAFADAIERVSKMTFGDLRASALARFSFDKMAAQSLTVYKELAK